MRSRRRQVARWDPPHANASRFPDTLVGLVIWTMVYEAHSNEIAVFPRVPSPPFLRSLDP